MPSGADGSCPRSHCPASSGNWLRRGGRFCDDSAASKPSTDKMSSGVPILRQSSASGQLLSILLLAACFFIGAILFPDPRIGGLVGALVYLCYSVGAKHLVAADHRKGIRLLQSKKYDQAVRSFERSYEFFSRHLWIDRNRALVMVSPSRISYREMALLNIAFCYGQLGKRMQAIEYYQRTLQEFPRSEVAKAALAMLNYDEQFGEP